MCCALVEQSGCTHSGESRAEDLLEVLAEACGKRAPVYAFAEPQPNERRLAHLQCVRDCLIFNDSRRWQCWQRSGLVACFCAPDRFAHAGDIVTDGPRLRVAVRAIPAVRTSSQAEIGQVMPV